MLFKNEKKRKRNINTIVLIIRFGTARGWGGRGVDNRGARQIAARAYGSDFQRPTRLNTTKIDFLLDASVGHLWISEWGGSRASRTPPRSQDEKSRIVFVENACCFRVRPHSSRPTVSSREGGRSSAPRVIARNPSRNEECILVYWYAARGRAEKSHRAKITSDRARRAPRRS